MKKKIIFLFFDIIFLLKKNIFFIIFNLIKKIKHDILYIYKRKLENKNKL